MSATSAGTTLPSSTIAFVPFGDVVQDTTARHAVDRRPHTQRVEVTEWASVPGTRSRVDERIDAQASRR